MKKRVNPKIKGIVLAFVFLLTLSFGISRLFSISKIAPAAFAQQSNNDPLSPESLNSPDVLNEGASQPGQTTDGTTTGSAGSAGTAAKNTETPEGSLDPGKLMAKVADLGLYLNRLFFPMINFFAFQTGNFLGNDYIYQGAMGEMLHRIWVVNRNVVNIIFVLILLGMALKEIFWLKDGGGDLKKNLIMFTLLLITVNFSWLATKVVLDAANVASNVVFAIPMGVSGAGIETLIAGQCNLESCNAEGTGCKKTTPGCILSALYMPTDVDPKNWQYMTTEDCATQNVSMGYDDAYKDMVEGKIVENTGTPYQGKKPYCGGLFNLAQFKKTTATIYLTYGTARIQNLVAAFPTDSITQLTVGIIFSLLLQTVYTVALLALFIALIVRMAVLWLFVAFSPFFIVIYALKGIGVQIMNDVEKQFSIGKFINWAFVPVKVGAVFSVGFLMIAAGQTINLKNANLNSNIVITGKIIKVNSLFMGMDTIQEFIWLLMTLIILWAGVFSVLGEMPGVKIITDRINKIGSEAGKWLATTPYWAPIVPIYDTETGKVRLKSMESQVVPAMRALPQWRQAQIVGSDEASRIDKAAKELALNSGKKDTLERIALENPEELGRKIADALGVSVRRAVQIREPIESAMKIAFADRPELLKRAWSALEAASKVGIGDISAPVTREAKQAEAGETPPPVAGKPEDGGGSAKPEGGTKP
jgi:hypothetical protein